MNMNATKKRFHKRVLAVLASLMMVVTVLATTMPAQAANIPVAGGTTTFNKYLVMDADANVPNVTFTFSIAAGSKVDATADSPAIYAGIGSPTVGSATFSAKDTTVNGLPTDSDTATSGKKYATEEVTVDFSNVSFTAPGIYRYIITEESSSASGITYDTTTTRTLDVYVNYKDDSSTGLEVSYVLYEETGNPNTLTKSDGFTNTYETSNLTLAKQVTGNQGDRDKYFEFTVTISNAVVGTVYTVDLTNADANPTVDGSSKTNAASLTVENGRTVSATYYLKHDQSIVIQGLTEDTQYTIAETDYTADGYTTTNTVDSQGSANGSTTGTQSMGTQSHTVIFTNTKKGTVPTGILLETAPYIILAAVVIAGFVVLTVSKRRRTHE